MTSLPGGKEMSTLASLHQKVKKPNTVLTNNSTFLRLSKSDVEERDCENSLLACAVLLFDVRQEAPVKSFPPGKLSVSSLNS